MHSFQTGDVIKCIYINRKGEKWIRNLVFRELAYGCNEYHKENQFLIIGYDLDKSALRTFAIKDMSNIKIIK